MVKFQKVTGLREEFWNYDKYYKLPCLGLLTDSYLKCS